MCKYATKTDKLNWFAICKWGFRSSLQINKLTVNVALYIIHMYSKHCVEQGNTMSQTLNGIQHDHKINSDVVTTVSTLGVILVIVSLVLVICYIRLCVKHGSTGTTSARTIASRKQTHTCSHESTCRAQFTRARMDHSVSISTPSNTNTVQINLPKVPKTAPSQPPVYDRPNLTTDAASFTGSPIFSTRATLKTEAGPGNEAITDAPRHTNTCNCTGGEHNIMYNGSSRCKDGPALHLYINQQVSIVSEGARKEVNGSCEGEREYTNVRAFDHTYLRYGKSHNKECF